MSAPVENCGNCAFGVKAHLHWGHDTFCHRHPPIVYVGEVGCKSEPTAIDGVYLRTPIMGEKTAWPKVNDSDFCGDFELKDAT